MTANDVSVRLKSAKRVAIFGHMHPDLDSFGAMLGAKFLCESLGVKCDVFAEFMKNLSFLRIFPETYFKHDFDKRKYDLVLIVDCNEISRIDKKFQPDVSDKKILFIDHHELNNVLEGADYYVYPKKCSASLVVFELLEKLNLKLSAEYATYIFAGVVGDTNRFLHTNTDASVFSTASKLLKLGADCQKVYDVVYRSMTMSNVRLRDYLFSNLKASGKVCYVAISQKDLEKLSSNVEDVKMFVSDINQLVEFSVAMIAYEISENKFKVSLRSKNGVDLLKVAFKYGGGGHKDASGFRILGNKSQVLKKLALISKEFEC